MDQQTAMVVGMSTGAKAVGEGIKLALAHHCRICQQEQGSLPMDCLMLDLMHRGRSAEKNCSYEDFVLIMGLDLEQS